jgi:tellurite resistance protein
MNGRTARLLPLNLFGIPFGLLGVADCWLIAARFGPGSILVGRALVGVAVLAWMTIGLFYLRGLRTHRVRLATELTNPIAGPFASLAAITPMLASADVLYPLDHPAGAVVTDVLIAATVVLAGWFTGQWIYRPLAFADLHPGYFLPSVAGGLVASASAGLIGQFGLARMLFGLGIVSWIVLGSIVLGRLMLGPALPQALIPTLSIEVAPAAVATFATFVLDGFRVTTVVRLLAGYGLLMLVAQLRLLPAYLRLSFMPSLWAFTFSWASVAFAGLSWLGIGHPPGWRPASDAVLTLISVLVGALAARTLLALRRGQLLPALGEEPCGGEWATPSGGRHRRSRPGRPVAAGRAPHGKRQP